MYPKTEGFLKELVDSKQIPGVSYGFVSKEKLINKVYGYKELVPTEVILPEGTLYDMASLTKVICTTTIILQLIEENQIELEGPLNKYLPDFLDKTVTIKELLTHTSDINPYIDKRDELNRKELRQAILGLSSGKKKGEKVAYTDTGTVLLGFLIEEIFKKPAQLVFKERILTPLEMNQSGFSFRDKSNIAPTEVTEKRGIIKGEVHDPKAYVLGETCGSAGLFSSLEDTLNFVQMMLQKGRYKTSLMLKEETVLDLLKSYTKEGCHPRSLGWDLLPFEGKHLLYHTGYTGTFMILDILEKEAFVFLSNRVHPVDNKEEYLIIRDELIKIYLSERQKP